MDRKALLAVVLMITVAVAPSVLFKPKPGVRRATARPDSVVAPPAAPAPSVAPAAPGAQPQQRLDSSAIAPVREDTLRVTTPLYQFGVSTRGARVVSARLQTYPSMVKGHNRQPAELFLPGSDVLGLTLISGPDTVRARNWPFTPSTATPSPGMPLTLTGAQGAYGLELTYRFSPEDYQIAVDGRVSGLGPNGGLILVSLGPGLRNAEADSNEHVRALALVTKSASAEATPFAKLAPGQPRTLSGPFEWAAIKTKYFVAALLAWDSAGGKIAGVTATGLPTGKHPTAADVQVSIPVGPDGRFSYRLYAGPLEYPRLTRIGHDFDDVNPYGWPGFRTLIRAVAVPVRWLLVWMHENLHLAYGGVLIVFGLLIRIVLWPLNQKAMRANMQLQAVQPLMKEIQEKYKNDPARLQQEMFKLYKEHNVNPLGGCWPMLLPMPVLFALFFVFQYSIELRGAPFLWIPDLAQRDPYYIIPLVMGLSMFWLTKMGQKGMEPNPQAKTMLYVMPVMMTVLFLNFPAGLNLYYAVSNLASIPQQYMLYKERQKRALTPPPPPRRKGKSGS
ncbi:MAG: membrane protein insertase YidC [Gemmatimonadota bacterium]